MYLQNLVVIKRFGLLGIFVTENIRVPYIFIVLFNNSFSAFFLICLMSKVFFIHVKFRHWYYLQSFYTLLHFLVKISTKNWHCRVIFELKLTRRCIRSEMRVKLTKNISLSYFLLGDKNACFVRQKINQSRLLYVS